MNEKPFKTVNGVDVYINENGQFWAEIGLKVYSRAKLKDLEYFIIKHTGKAKKVIEVHKSEIEKPLVINAMGVRGSGEEVRDENMEWHAYYGRIYVPYDEELLRKLNVFYETHLVLENEYLKAIDELKPVTPEYFKDAPAG